VRDPIFIIGTERSGTNLLRLILNSHSNISVPHPPHIMKYFHPIEHLYGNLNIDKNFKKLIDDVCRLVDLHTYPWEIKPNRKQVFNNVTDKKLLNIYFEINNQYLKYAGKKRWVCKSTFMIDYVADILKHFPDARFIYMVRDGRDVAVSSKSSIFNDYHIYYTAKRWSNEQQLGLSWMKRLKPEQIMMLKYEDLLNDPVKEVHKICSFLNETYEEVMIKYHNSAEAKKSGSLSISWGNTSKPVMVGNKGKYLYNLSKKEIKIFEAIAFEELKALGYELKNPISSLEKVHDEYLKPRFNYWLAEKSMFMKTETIHMFKDKNSRLRLKKLWFVRYIRMKRRIF